MISKLKTRINNYFNSDKNYTTLIAIASGLYPMIYCFSRNFSLFNSLDHLLFFLLVFIVLPILFFNLMAWLLKVFKLRRYSIFVSAMLNVFMFLFFIKTITYTDAKLKKTFLVIFIAFLFAVFLRKHLKRLVVLQYMMALVGFFYLIFIIYNNLKVSNDWQNQPDTIESVIFKKKPNVYVIQPDGYVNFSELKSGFYNYDNSVFETFLEEKKFTTYPKFRSNYSTTLSSNASFFMMKHHYYNNPISDFELYNARDMIISENPVLNVFKNNGYKTYYVSETDYLLYNRPEMGYDYCNIEYDDLPYIRPSISEPKLIDSDLQSTISEVIDKPKFFFIQLLSPWHINTKEGNTVNNKEIERGKWLANLSNANDKLTETISLIKQEDTDALILIMADHGGYVGFDYADESLIMTQNRDLIYSIFGSQLSIHWPNGDVPDFNGEFVSSVNVFRLLFSHLSQDKKYLEYLQPNESYQVLREGVEVGIYKYIDEEGDIILKQYK